MNLVVIDNSTFDNGALAQDRSLHPHAIHANSVHNMVIQILARLRNRGDTIGNLVIWGHGVPGVQGMGTGMDLNHPVRNRSRVIALDGGGRLVNQDELSRLCGKFSQGALVELHGCSVGAHRRGHELLLRLSDLWGVTVEGDTASQPSDRANRFFSGPVVQAYHPQPGQSAQWRLEQRH